MTGTTTLWCQWSARNGCVVCAILLARGGHPIRAILRAATGVTNCDRL